MQTPAIKSVEIEKDGRFWAVNVDGQMLAIVLYKRGALAVRSLVCGLSGLPEPEARRSTKAAKPSASDTNPPTETGASKPTTPGTPKPKAPTTPKAKTKKASTPRSRKSTKKS